MALTGTLRDVAIVALLQFPDTGKRSGVITVDSKGGNASFYYDGGKLVHAVLGDTVGEEVLVRAVDWVDGEFSFEPGVQTPDRTIDKDLHRCIMWALKERDERKKMGVVLDAPTSSSRSPELEKLVSESESFVYASMLDAKGTVLCSSVLPGETGEVISGLQKSVSAMLSEYPGRTPKRVIIDDERFTMISELIDGSGNVLLAVAEPGTRMGILPIAVARIVEALKREN